MVQVVPLTTAIRGFGSEVQIEPDPANGLVHRSSAQCQHVRAVSTGRIERALGNVGGVTLAQIRDTIGVILDLPF
ncbi:MAG: type II toxin-antitoxin system PemK/MazF family toxin [Acidimicrobiia bacterium]